MSIAGNGKKLEMVTGELLREWDKTKPYWMDAKRKAFEEEYIDGMRTAVTAAARACGKLDEVIRRIRQDCE